MIAKDGELPRSMARRVWHEPLKGLLITAATTLLVASLVGLSRLTTMDSSGFLLLFAVVIAASVRLAGWTASRWVSVLGAVLCLTAPTSLLWQTVRTAPSHVPALVAIAGMAPAIEVRSRRFVAGGPVALGSTGDPDRTARPPNAERR